MSGFELSSPSRGGFQLGTANLESMDHSKDGIVLIGQYTFHPSKELWFAAFIHDDFSTFCDRLDRMEELGNGGERRRWYFSQQPE